MARSLMTVDRHQTLICGHALFRGESAELIDAIARLREEPTAQLVVTPNVDQVLLAGHDPAAADAFGDAALLLADGAPLVGLARLLGDTRVRRHTGADLIQLAAREAASRGWRIAIVGGEPSVARMAAARLSDQNPGAALIAVPTPRLSGVRDSAGAALVEELRRLQPDIVFLCFGFPRQEAWWAHWRSGLPAAVYVGAGAAVDFAAGTKTRAPRFAQRLGIEWMWRLAQEPRRLTGRYLVRGPRFAGTVIRSLLHGRKREVAR